MSRAYCHVGAVKRRYCRGSEDAVTARLKESDTQTRILDISERWVQSRGFNAFSYGDVAKELGITRAALHYHFASKAELGEALVTRYAARFNEALEALDATQTSAVEALVAYTELYANVLADGRMCLCGMLAGDFETLPAAMKAKIVTFFDDNERWLAGVLDRGRRNQELAFDGPAVDEARMIVGALEGAMLIARPYGDVARFESTCQRLISDLST